MVEYSTSPITAMNTQPVRKLRSLNSENWMNGRDVDSKGAKKKEKPTAETMNSARISFDSSQPSCSPRSSASCSEPMPTASAVKPNQSKRRFKSFFVSSMNTIRPSTVKKPNGKLTKNTQCQE